MGRLNPLDPEALARLTKEAQQQQPFLTFNFHKTNDGMIRLVMYFTCPDLQDTSWSAVSRPYEDPKENIEEMLTAAQEWASYQFKYGLRCGESLGHWAKDNPEKLAWLTGV